jgi:hypothetical protein
MTMPTFHFDRYTLRPAEGEADRALAAQWMEQDVWHRGQFTPEFWLEQSAAANSFVLEDEIGPVFFFKTQLEGHRVVPKQEKVGVDLFIQFSPGGGLNRLRTLQGLDRGMKWMRRRLGGLGYDAVFFTTKNPQLAVFAERRLGFVVDSESETGTRLKAYLERAA